jgi:hypothetical protein
MRSTAACARRGCAATAAVATFTKAGTYNFLVTIADAQNATVTSARTVTVNATVTTVAVTPASVTMRVGGTATFSAVASDQFGAPLAVGEIKGPHHLRVEIKGPHHLSK